MGGQVEVPFRVRVLGQGQVLHQVVIPADTSDASVGLSQPRSPNSGGWGLVISDLEGMRAMNSSPEGQSFSL